MCESKCKFGCESSELTETYMGDSFCNMDCVLGYIQFSTGDNYRESLETYELNKDWVNPDPNSPKTMSLEVAEQELEDFNVFSIVCDKCGTPMHEYFYVDGNRACSEQCRSEYVDDSHYDKWAPNEDMYWSESDQFIELGDSVWSEDGTEFVIVE